MAYASASHVAFLTANLINNASNFSASTTPTLNAVNFWLSSGSAIINTRLQTRGLTPPASGTNLYDLLSDLNATYAAAQAEMARTNVRLAPQERTRGQVLMEDFNKGLDAFLKGDLSRAGLGYTHAGYVGGVSKSDKDGVESNADRAPTRFKKDKFQNPAGAQSPNSQERNS